MHDLARRLGVSMIVRNDNAVWVCLLSCQGRMLRTNYAAPSAPTIADVLIRTANIAAGCEHGDFAVWCAEGFMQPSHAARRVFELCREEQRTLRALLGHDGYVTALLLAGHCEHAA